MGYEQRTFSHNHQIDCGEHQNLLGKKRNVIIHVALGALKKIIFIKKM